MKKSWFMALLLFLFLVMPFAISAADIQMHGDLNNRFTVYNNHIDLFSQHILHNGTVSDSWGEAKTDSGGICHQIMER